MLKKPELRKSYRLNKVTKATDGKQTIALCFEGLCASVSPIQFSYSEDDESFDAKDDVKLRDNFFEALMSLRKATSDAISIVIYTYMSQESFD